MSENIKYLTRAPIGPAYLRGMTPLTINEFLERSFPPREMLLAPWLPGLCMVYGPRGIGKTHVSLGVAYAVATGGEFLGWGATQPRRVLHIDGEMPGALLKTRIAGVVAANADRAPPPPEFLRFLSAEVEPDGLPDLADAGAQHFYEPHLADADLVVV